jgi:dephospho-CoA kinase
MFAALGAPVYDSDSRARELMNGHGGIRRAIVELLGEEAYRDEALDNAFVASKVFADKMLLASLNAIVHPAVALDFDAWTRAFTDRPYVVLESAILFESGFNRIVDRVVAVSAPVEVRLERVLARGGGASKSGDAFKGRGDAFKGRGGDGGGSDAFRGGSVFKGGGGISREDVARRMANQLTDSEREARAWRTIDNGGNLTDLAASVQRIHSELTTHEHPAVTSCNNSTEHTQLADNKLKQ